MGNAYGRALVRPPIGGIAQAFVQDLQQVFRLPAILALFGADALFEHLEAEGAGYAYGVGAGF